MKKYLMILTVLISAIVLLSSYISFTNIKKTENVHSDTNTYYKHRYIVKNFNGYVAVYEYGNDLPVQILDCKINSLPPDAAEALVTGIEVSSEDELQKIIEAYD